MTTPLIRPTASVTIDGGSFHLRRGSACSLDSRRVPYAEGALQLPMLDEATLGALDPRTGARVVVSHAIDGGTPRTFDLAVKQVQADHRARTVSLQLASDEMLLQKYRALAVDAGARAHEASCRAVCDYVLDKIGAALEAGADDADVTAYWSVTNLITNPSAEVDLTGWAAVQACTLSQYTSGGYAGSASVLVTITGAGDAVVRLNEAGAGPAVTAGASYVFDSWSVINPVVAPSIRLRIHWLNNAGQIVGLTTSDPVASTNGWERPELVATAPVGASRVDLFAIVDDVTTAGHTFLLDAAMFHPGDEAVPYFDGATADDANYDYGWDNVAHASTATRTPAIERRPELFVWKPGVSAWEFLIAITASAGLVLWCDEAREWRLATAEHRTLVSLVSVTEGNTRGGSDTIDLDDDETTPTGVVVKYTWTDANGMRREEYDTAGTPERVYTVELSDRAYPGPGTAAAMLARRLGTGRRQDVDTITQLSVTPGMTAQVSLPAAPDTVGRVASVEFDLAQGFMTLGLAGVVDIIPGSIDALIGTIDSLTGTIDSL